MQLIGSLYHIKQTAKSLKIVIIISSNILIRYGMQKCLEMHLFF